jgi:hypothetical protein
LPPPLFLFLPLLVFAVACFCSHRERSEGPRYPRHYPYRGHLLPELPGLFGPPGKPSRQRVPSLTKPPAKTPTQPKRKSKPTPDFIWTYPISFLDFRTSSGEGGKVPLTIHPQPNRSH